MEIKDLKEATSQSGGKAYGLAILNKMEVPVPNGFVINNSNDIGFTEIEKEEIKKRLEMLEHDKKLAVRSSALAEDGLTQSFAGVFETVLNVEPNIANLEDAIHIVNNSANSEVVKSYTDNENQSMNIIIQEMVDPILAGVLFTKATDINGDDVVLIECVDGLADKLVSGAVTPTRIIVKLDDGKLDIDNVKIEWKLIDISSLNNLFPFLQKIIDTSRIPLDIEWCIDEQKRPYFVQARPMTTELFINKKSSKNGIIASQGYAEGMTYVIDESLDDIEIKKLIDEFPKDAILIAGITETLYMPAIRKAKGIITEEGSALSHAAIVSRELGIPCIAGYKNAITLFPTGTKITLDASNGKIITDKVQTSCDEEKSFEFGELYCFDNTTSIIFNNHKAVIESTYDGLILHLPEEDIEQKTINEMELYVRKAFKTSPTHCVGGKYLWYFEVERFKKLPYYNEINSYVMELIQNKNCDDLDQFYIGMLTKLKELVEYRDKTINKKETLIVGEIGAYFNLILDASLPLGYALRECYLDSLSALNQTGNTFNDLIGNRIEKYDSDGTLKKTQEFLNRVAKNRNEVFEKIHKMGGTTPKYFEERDEKFKLFLSNEGISNYENPIDAFYENLKESDFKNINDVFGDLIFYFR